MGSRLVIINFVCLWSSIVGSQSSTISSTISYSVIKHKSSSRVGGTVISSSNNTSGANSATNLKSYSGATETLSSNNQTVSYSVIKQKSSSRVGGTAISSSNNPSGANSASNQKSYSGGTETLSSNNATGSYYSMSTEQNQRTETPWSSANASINTLPVSSSKLTQSIIFPSSTYNPFPVTSSASPTKPKPLIIAFSLRFDENFNGNLNDKESLAYLTKQSQVLKILNTAYENETEFLLANVNGCELGDKNLLCNGRVYFNNFNGNVTELSQTLNSFLQESELYNDSSVAKFESTNKEQPDKVDDDDDDDDVILGLNWWQIGVIAAGLVILILLIAVICLHAKLQKIKKKHYTENLMYGNQLFGDDDIGEMKTLRASPTRLEDDLTMETNHNTIDMKSFSSASPKKDDGLVKETEVKIGVGNDATGSHVAPGDVIKL